MAVSQVYKREAEAQGGEEVVSEMFVFHGDSHGSWALPKIL